MVPIIGIWSGTPLDGVISMLPVEAPLQSTFVTNSIYNKLSAGVEITYK